jgi:hypothetical protein
MRGARPRLEKALDKEFASWVDSGVRLKRFAAKFPEVDFPKVAHLLGTNVGRQVLRELFPPMRTERGDLPSAIAKMDARKSVATAREALQYAQTIARWVIDTRTIPPGKAQEVASAIQVVLSLREPSSRKLAAWWEENSESFRLLAEALDWSERGAMGRSMHGGTFVVGPFTLHDTIHLDAEGLKTVTAYLETSIDALQAKGLPYTKVLYGDVFIVGQLKGPTTLAWYRFKYDNVYVRPYTRRDLNVAKSILHELGHRFWTKDLDDRLRAAWLKRFKALSRTPKMPPVGSVLYDGEKEVHVKEYLSKEKVVRVDVVEAGERRALRTPLAAFKANLSRLAFPSIYSATDVKEFFAESFAFYMLDTLKGEHREVFERLTQVKP